MTTATPAADRIDAFHALGTAIPAGMTIPDAMAYAHMNDWNVRKQELVAQVPGGAVTGMMSVPVKGKFAVLRDNPFNGRVEALGVVGDKWTPFQNESTVGLLTNIVDEADAELTTLGVMDEGRKTFASMRLPGHMEFTSPVDGSTDVTDLYLSVFNSHDGNGALSVVVSPVRLMCCNQQRMAEGRAKSRFMLRHTGNASAKLAEVRSMLGLTFRYQDVFAADCQRLIDRELDEAEVMAALQQVFQVDKAETEGQKVSRIGTATQVFELYKQSDTVAPFRGTAFGAYNAVTEYADHFMRVGRKGNEDAQRATRSLVSDGLSDTKGRAFDLLLPV
jgi:phage/plasmid-like protein (TIGR03299 family)